MIRFTCEKCGKHLTVPDEAAGRVGRCPGCESRVQAPGRRQTGRGRDAPCRESSEDLVSTDLGRIAADLPTTLAHEDPVAVSRIGEDRAQKMTQMDSPTEPLVQLDRVGPPRSARGNNRLFLLGGAGGLALLLLGLVLGLVAARGNGKQDDGSGPTDRDADAGEDDEKWRRAPNPNIVVVNKKWYQLGDHVVVEGKIRNVGDADAKSVRIRVRILDESGIPYSVVESMTIKVILFRYRGAEQEALFAKLDRSAHETFPLGEEIDYLAADTDFEFKYAFKPEDYCIRKIAKGVTRWGDDFDTEKTVLEAIRAGRYRIQLEVDK